jgi:hypothetical protein
MLPPRALAVDTGRVADIPYGEYVAQARRTLAESVPRSAATAESDASRVLWIAATANSPSEDGRIADAARSGWRVSYVPGTSTMVAPAVARRFDEVARQAYHAHRDLVDVFELQLRAFGANPADPDVAGNLAFLYLKLSPPQPETARQLALHAMALRGVQLRVARADDWTTFAIASALTGREDDARNALYVTIAVARNLDLSCRAALSSLTSHGDPLRRPVRAMMLRIQASGRQYGSPSCAWPSQWVAGAR